MKPLDGPIHPGGGDMTPQQKQALQDAIATAAKMRDIIRQGRALPGLPAGEMPDFDHYERRIDEIEALIHSDHPEDADRAIDLVEDFMLHFDADVARAMSGFKERTVRTLDQVVQRHEQIKFELTSEERESMEEEVIGPYKDQLREAMLGSLPIEKRRELEAEKSRREADDEAPGEGPGSTVVG